MNPDGLCIQLQQCPVVELQAHTRHMAVLTRSESRETAGLSLSPCSDQRASCSIEGVSFAMGHPSQVLEGGLVAVGLEIILT